MNKVEILQELPKWDTETRKEQMLSEHGTNKLARQRAATNPQLVKTEKPKSTNQTNHYL